MSGPKHTPASFMDADHMADLKGRAERRFAVIDSLPKATRELIHEYGWAAVKELMGLGVTNPTRLRHIIKTIRGEQT